MKGLVLEINDDHAAILLTDGQIIKIKNKAYQVGQEIDYTLNTSTHSKGISKIVAFAALILIFFGSSAWLYSQPYYEVSVDVNPSVLLTVNAFERVIDVTYMNEDAKDALEHTSFKHKSIKKAVSYVIDDIEKAGYFSEPREIIVATAGKNIKRSQALASDLSEVIQEASEELDQKPLLSSEALGYEMVEKARLQGITPGLYNQRLKEESLDEQDWNNELDKPEDHGRPESPGKSEDSGKPETPGKSEDSGKPESPGKSEDQGRPESPGKSEDSGKPESPGKSEDSGKPESPGKSEDHGKPEVDDELEENDGLDEDQNQKIIGKPLKPGKSDETGKPDKNQKPKKEDSPGNQNKSNPSSGKTK